MVRPRGFERSPARSPLLTLGVPYEARLVSRCSTARIRILYEIVEIDTKNPFWDERIYCLHGATERTRTSDLDLRRVAFYPAKLRSHVARIVWMYVKKSIRADDCRLCRRCLIGALA